MSKIKCVVGGTLIGAGGIYVGAMLTARFFGYVFRKGEKMDEFVRMYEECRKKMEESR